MRERTKEVDSLCFCILCIFKMFSNCYFKILYLKKCLEMLRNLLSSNMPTSISNDHIVSKTCLRLGESPSTLFKSSNGILFAKDQDLLKHYFFIHHTI